MCASGRSLGESVSLNNNNYGALAAGGMGMHTERALIRYFGKDAILYRLVSKRIWPASHYHTGLHGLDPVQRNSLMKPHLLAV